ncbi:MAG: HD domain-containing protein [Spirochaetes bacterium]|nr:HD domain-containing protein [Spirochaetota bacterium]
MSLLVDVFMALSRSIDLVDPNIGGHNKRVAYIAGRLAHCIGLNPDNITKTVIAAALHDIGVLKEADYKELAHFDYEGSIDYHSIMGYRFLDSCPLTKNIAPIIKYHHVSHSEKKNITEDSIPIASEIIHIADRVDVLIDYRSDLLTQKDAICDSIREHSGNRFNPELVKCFISLAQQESFWFDLQFNNIERTIKGYIFYNPILTLEQAHDIAKLFTKIIDFRSRFTASHSTSVAMVARELGRLLKFSEKECLMLDIAGHLHDIGKLAIPLSILEKPDKLLVDEWRVMKRHAYFTYQILNEIDDPVFKIINEYASLHHEKMDGSGYPFKMAAQDLTMGSRILAVADMFTALAESRPYRLAMDDSMLIDELKKAKSKSLDPYIVDVLISHYGELKEVRKKAFCETINEFESIFDKVQ